MSTYIVFFSMLMVVIGIAFGTVKSCKPEDEFPEPGKILCDKNGNEYLVKSTVGGYSIQQLPAKK